MSVSIPRLRSRLRVGVFWSGVGVGRGRGNRTGGFALFRQLSLPFYIFGCEQGVELLGQPLHHRHQTRDLFSIGFTGPSCLLELCLKGADDPNQSLESELFFA